MIPSINKNDHTNHPKFGLFLLTLGNVELQDFVNTLLESICDSMDEDKTTPSDTTKRTKRKTYQKTGFSGMKLRGWRVEFAKLEETDTFITFYSFCRPRNVRRTWWRGRSAFPVLNVNDMDMSLGTTTCLLKFTRSCSVKSKIFSWTGQVVQILPWYITMYVYYWYIVDICGYLWIFVMVSYKIYYINKHPNARLEGSGSIIW